MNAIDLTERVRQIDTANIISISVVLLVPPGIQGILNRTLAAALAAAVNTQLHAIYHTGAHTARFSCSCFAELTCLRARPRRRGRHAARLHQHGRRQRGCHQLPGRAGQRSPSSARSRRSTCCRACARACRRRRASSACTRASTSQPARHGKGECSRPRRRRMRCG